MIFIGGMVFLAHLFSAIYKRRMIPDVLMLLVIGLIIGPVLKLITPSHLGSIGPVFTTITLVVILFESGTSLTMDSLRKSWMSTMRLTITGLAITIAVLAAIMMIFLNYPLNSAIVFGAILGGTSSAIVIPLVEQLSVTNESKTTLILESTLTDVLCIVIVLACVHGYSQGDYNVGKMVGNVLSSFVFASFMGFGGALIWSRYIRYVRQIKNSIFTTPAFVFIIYGSAELLGYNGPIAALVFGISMGNLDTFNGFIVQKLMGGSSNKLNDTEMIFLREMAFILKTFFFIYIGMSIIFEDVFAIINGLIVTAVVFAIRLMVAKFASPSSATIYDKSIISILAPKGLAAAVLATIPEMVGMPEGTAIKNITYSVVLFTILTSSVLIILNNKSEKLQAFYKMFFNKDLSVGRLKTHKWKYHAPEANLDNNSVANNDSETPSNNEGKK